MKAIICGTKKDSIGRYVAEDLVRENWEVWLYSRSVDNRDNDSVHERRVDLTHSDEIDVLVSEVGNPDLVVMSADTGGAFGLFEGLGFADVRAFLDAKILGSILFVQSLLRHNAQTKIIFLGGKIGQKSKDFLLYGVVNSAMMALVEEINRHYPSQMDAYYLETPVIWPSPVAERYVHMSEQSVDGQSPSVVTRSLRRILKNEYTPGFVPCVEGKVL